MNIGIDASIFKIGAKMTGIGISTLEIINELNQLDKNNHYFLFSNEPIELNLKLNSNWEIIIDSFKSRRLIWLNLRMNSLLKEHKIDVFWTSNHILPVFKSKGTKYIVTINDIALFKFNNIGSNSNTLVQKLFVKRSCKNADLIISISGATKKDLIELFNLREEKIKVIYLGGTSEKKTILTPDIIQKVKEKYKIYGEYFLYIGTLEPRKNISTLVKAFDIYKKTINSDYKLVLAGGKGWKFDTTLQLIKDSQFKTDIIQTGYISNEDKAALYKNCKAFIFPSLYEGFGIPVLEAMSYDIPVVISKSSSLPEVGGEAALYLNDVTNHNELSEILTHVAVLNEDELLSIKNANRIQRNKFSWAKCAQEMVFSFQSVTEKDRLTKEDVL